MRPRPDPQLAGLWQTVALEGHVFSESHTALNWMLNSRAGPRAEAADLAASAFTPIHIEPDEHKLAVFGGGLLVPRYKIVAVVGVGAVAPAVNFVLGMRSIAAYAGASGSVNVTLNAALTGSTFTVGLPGANAGQRQESVEFAVDQAGAYVLTVTPSGTPVAGSRTIISAELLRRYVRVGA